MPTLDWIGKAAVVNHHRKVPYGDPDAGNLLVQGDNLAVLKALLPYYVGKVKCIYIDPPYVDGLSNVWTWNDWLGIGVHLMAKERIDADSSISVERE